MKWFSNLHLELLSKVAITMFGPEEGLSGVQERIEDNPGAPFAMVDDVVTGLYENPQSVIEDITIYVDGPCHFNITTEGSEICERRKYHIFMDLLNQEDGFSEFLGLDEGSNPDMPFREKIEMYCDTFLNNKSPHIMDFADPMKVDPWVTFARRCQYAAANDSAFQLRTGLGIDYLLSPEDALYQVSPQLYYTCAADRSYRALITLFHIDPYSLPRHDPRMQRLAVLLREEISAIALRVFETMLAGKADHDAYDDGPCEYEEEAVYNEVCEPILVGENLVKICRFIQEGPQTLVASSREFSPSFGDASNPLGRAIMSTLPMECYGCGYDWARLEPMKNWLMWLHPENVTLPTLFGKFIEGNVLGETATSHEETEALHRLLLKSLRSSYRDDDDESRFPWAGNWLDDTEDMSDEELLEAFFDHHGMLYDAPFSDDEWSDEDGSDLALSDGLSQGAEVEDEDWPSEDEETASEQEDGEGIGKTTLRELQNARPELFVTFPLLANSW